MLALDARRLSVPPEPGRLLALDAAGLEQLFRTNAEWTSVTVRPGAGTAATVAMLVAHDDRSPLQARATCAPSACRSSRALNAGGEALDRAVPLLREPVPGSLNANYHVEAVA